MNHWVSGALLTPSSPYTLGIPCIDPTYQSSSATYDVDVSPGQTITVISVEIRGIDRFFWRVTALFPDGVVHTALISKDDFIPV